MSDGLVDAFTYERERRKRAEARIAELETYLAAPRAPDTAEGPDDVKSEAYHRAWSAGYSAGLEDAHTRAPDTGELSGEVRRLRDAVYDLAAQSRQDAAAERRIHGDGPSVARMTGAAFAYKHAADLLAAALARTPQEPLSTDAVVGEPEPYAWGVELTWPDGKVERVRLSYTAPAAAWKPSRDCRYVPLYRTPVTPQEPEPVALSDTAIRALNAMHEHCFRERLRHMEAGRGELAGLFRSHGLGVHEVAKALGFVLPAAPVTPQEE